MIRHFIKLGIRNLNKNKDNTLISVLSLSLGIAILLVISIFASNELSVDNFHQNASHIYKVYMGTHQLFGFSPLLSYNTDLIEIEKYYAANAYFFSVFDFQVLQGDINEA